MHLAKESDYLAMYQLVAQVCGQKQVFEDTKKEALEAMEDLKLHAQRIRESIDAAKLASLQSGAEFRTEEEDREALELCDESLRKSKELVAELEKKASSKCPSLNASF